MKKTNLQKLALMGLSSGLMVSVPLCAQNGSPVSTKSTAPSPASNKTNSQDNDEYGANDGNMNYHLMSEDELKMELEPKGVEMYNSLTPEGRLMARKVASQMCNGTNPCKGYNACQTDQNQCAGKGSCKGKSKCAFSDKNLAVKVVSDKMKQKREAATR